LGCDGVFVGSGIFKSGDPSKRAKAIVQQAPASSAILACSALMTSMMTPPYEKKSLNNLK